MSQAGPGQFGAQSDLNREGQLVSGSILGCAWMQGVCKHRAGSWAAGRMAPTSISPRGLYLAKEEALVPSLGCVWELPAGTAPPQGWDGGTRLCRGSRTGGVAGQGLPEHLLSPRLGTGYLQGTKHLSSHSTEAPKSSSPAPKLHPHVREPPARPGFCGQHAAPEVPWHQENLIAKIPQPEGLRGIRELQTPDKRVLE